MEGNGVDAYERGGLRVRVSCAAVHGGSPVRLPVTDEDMKEYPNLCRQDLDFAGWTIYNAPFLCPQRTAYYLGRPQSQRVSY